MTVAYNEKYVATCPVRAVEQFIAVGKHVGWDMTTSGYLFPAIFAAEKKGNMPIRGRDALTAPQMSQSLKEYALEAGEKADLSMHSFRSGGAVSRALARETHCPLSCRKPSGRTQVRLGDT